MKSTIYLLATILFVGCADQKAPVASDNPSVFVSIIPQVGIAKAIAGDLYTVEALVAEGQSPHSYEPTALQLVRLGKAKTLITIGVPFEEHLLKKITPIYPHLAIFDSHKNIALRTMPHAHHGVSCTHEHGEKDPHVWLSPDNLILIADRFRQCFEQLDPEHAEVYRENYDRYVQQVKQLDADISRQLQPFSGSRIYVFHPSYGYFCDAYHLQQVPVELEGKSPSPRQLVELIEQAKADGVQVLFVQKQFPVDSAQAIANAINGTVTALDPLAEDSIANLRVMSESIAQALKK